MLDRLATVPDLVVQAVEGMSMRLMRPKMTPTDIAAAMMRDSTFHDSLLRRMT